MQKYCPVRGMSEAQMYRVTHSNHFVEARCPVVPQVSIKHTLCQPSTNPPPDSPGQEQNHTSKCTANYYIPPGKYPREVFSTKEFKGIFKVHK